MYAARVVCSDAPTARLCVVRRGTARIGGCAMDSRYWVQQFILGGVNFVAVLVFLVQLRIEFHVKHQGIV